ncbi:hypothetical protein CC86DRAFT_385136 [Ophiobolus disseminans]|uniref:Uncharacterized protein n=1 Tax=Ophiobolus disseminans TaxID=1469910 RepID=A0A6A6ZPD0_9PLEO|nr:hypothetical protein CC86DRAFT_385136 [Ophiobolus disseminans]
MGFASAIDFWLVNCTSELEDTGMLRLLGDSMYLLDMKGVGNGCAVFECFDFKDFKIVPSTPRPIAFGQSYTATWLFWNITVIGIVWSTRHAISGPEVCEENCKGPDYIDWFFFVYDAVSTLYWWVVFFMFAHDRTNRAPVSLFAWWAMFRYIVTIRRHPISCRLAARGIQRHKITAAVYLLAYCQLIATCFSLAWKWPDLSLESCMLKDSSDGCDFRRKYNCVPAHLASAPRSTNCLTE